MTRIDLDSASSTPLLPEVKAAIAAMLDESGNPSSIHQSGRRARQALERVRAQVAALINAKPEEITFTSCGTESNGWALRGLLTANPSTRHIPVGQAKLAQDSAPQGSPAGLHKRKGAHLVISSIEHPSVSLAARRLELEGVNVTILPVDHEGVVSVERFRAALTDQTALVSVMLANGEVGTIEPLAELAAIAHEHGALFHTDAIAAAGHAPIDVKALGVDALSLAANQFYGPPGAAALFVRDGVRILPLLEGGGQERGGRSGTESLPAIVGMGVAAEIATRVLPRRIEHAARLRDRLRDGLQQRIEALRLNGSWTFRLPHNLHLCIDGVSSESLVLGLDQAGISAGIGSACNSKAMRPSPVLKAMGCSDEQANGALVLTVGASMTDAEIQQALEMIPQVVQRLRNVTALTARST